MKRTVAVLGTVVGLVLLFAATATAGATTETTHWKNVPFVDSEVDCFGAAATITGTTSGVEHVTMTDTGGFHVTFTEQGRFMLVSANGTFTGHFAIWGGFNHNNRNEGGTFTFNAVGRSATGERIRLHGVEHVNFTANGVERSFGKFTCTQG
ncbi:MAG TPA: hypothetical protein VK926_06530 [Gaiellaceae bacterium]|nr:hypothetical protein [Gaiellaceae bacterium]